MMRLAALALLSGCSFVVMHPPEKPRRSDCTVLPAIVDTLGVAVTVAVRADRECPPLDEPCHLPSAQRKATELVVGTAFVASAIYGYIAYGLCRRDAASP